MNEKNAGILNRYHFRNRLYHYFCKNLNGSTAHSLERHFYLGQFTEGLSIGVDGVTLKEFSHTSLISY